MIGFLARDMSYTGEEVCRSQLWLTHLNLLVNIKRRSDHILSVVDGDQEQTLQETTVCKHTRLE